MVNLLISNLKGSKLSYVQMLVALTQTLVVEITETDAEYTQINPTPTVFAAPAFPCVLTIDVTTAVVEAVHAKEKHHKAMRVYREYNNVEKALLCHT